MPEFPSVEVLDEKDLLSGVFQRRSRKSLIHVDFNHGLKPAAGAVILAQDAAKRNPGFTLGGYLEPVDASH